jgi:hypothetical protein
MATGTSWTGRLTGLGGVWRFHPDRRALSDPDSRALLRAAETRTGAVYFEDDEGPGLNYVTSGFYPAQRLGGVQQAYADAGWSDADVQFAATFGIA